ncbi:hypothetical protein DNR46_36310 [Mesorhizobium japonicum]|uniref:Uncharacterized protein n=1 Tax=Mesorhizobium japonicum TaxID=2066070 RepID=A0A3M9WZH8_9HYPH|nr:hypothetical protein DNR46_36310 [Mesorhizobium japonicum]
MDGFQFAALHSLQYGLARQAVGLHGVADGPKAVARRGQEAGLEFRGQANASWRTGCNRFALNACV